MQIQRLGLIGALAFAVPATASADDKQEIETLIGKHVQAAALSGGADDDGGDAMRSVMIDNPVIEPPTRGLLNAMCSCESLTADHKLDKLTIVVEPTSRVAWFHGSYKAKYHPLFGNKQLPMAAIRINGVAIDDKGWKLAAIMYARTMSDADLSKYAEEEFLYANADPKSVTGDPAVRLVVESLFQGRFKQHAATDSPLRASGTAPAENAADAGAVRLVTAWDRLGLRHGPIVAHVWKGAIGFALVDVGLPSKRRKGGAPMRLGAVFLPRGTPQGAPAWRWVSLSFGVAERLLGS